MPGTVQALEIKQKTKETKILAFLRLPFECEVEEGWVGRWHHMMMSEQT